MTASGSGPIQQNLRALSDRLLSTAREAESRRAVHAVHRGEGLLQQTAIALLDGAELPEHDAPPEATLQVLAGRIRLNGQGRQWELPAGNLIEIPQERHSVTALDDSVVLLTVRTEIDEAARAGQGPSV